MGMPQNPQEWGATQHRPAQAGWPPQQMGYPAQPPVPYPQGPGYGQQYPGYQAYQGGPGRPPAKKHSTSLVIGLIVLGIVLAAGLGALVSLMGRGEPEAPPTVVTTPSTSTPTPTQTASRTPGPTPTPTEEGTGSTVTLDGMVITVPPGWEVGATDEEKKAVQLVDVDGNVVLLQTFHSAGKVSNMLVDEYLAAQMAKLTKPRKYPVKKVNIDPAVDVSEGGATGTRTTSSGSMVVGINALISVRGKDKQALMSTLVYNVRSDTAALGKAYNTITNSALDAQIEG